MYRIKNWQRFQRYKRDNVPWIKLHKRLLDDPEWHKLEAHDAKVLVMLWLIAAESNDGSLPCLEKLAFRLRVPEKSLQSNLSRLSHWVVNEFTTNSQVVVKEVFSEREGERDNSEREIICKTLEILNAKAGRHFIGYHPNGEMTANGVFIDRLLKRGYTERDLKRVILHRWQKWKDDPKMAEYLRPETLFNQTKFAQYFGDLAPETEDSHAMP